MCGCDFNFVCPKCEGTRHDPAYMDEESPRELELLRRERELSSVDFRRPFGEMA